MYMKSYWPDMVSLLTAVADQIREFQLPVNQYLGHNRHYKESSGYWERLGISHVLASISGDSMGTRGGWPAANGKTGNAAGGWNSMKNEAIIEALKVLLGNCAGIRLAEWTKRGDAADCWTGLFTDVIKPLDKRDFEFIFNPGDVSKKLLFEVDEFMDIMSDYASYGKITLVLEEHQAEHLWSRLGGRASYATSSGFRTPGAKDKYLFLFNTMSIDVLLVLAGNRVVLLSGEGRFEFPVRGSDRVYILSYNRECFCMGYQLGLSMRLELPQCAALGLALSGAHTVQGARPAAKELLTYIDDWITDLHPDEILQNEL